MTQPRIAQLRSPASSRCLDWSSVLHLTHTLWELL